jgi:hypothetical protein
VIVRFLIIAAAFVAAILAASELLAVTIWVGMLAPGGFAEIDLRLLKYLSFFTLLLTVPAAGAQTLLVVVYGEWAGKRSAAYYAAAGAICGLIALGLYIAFSVWRRGSSRLLDALLAMQVVSPAGGLVVAVAVIGLISGLLYWAIAGRRAGSARN